MTSGHPGNYTTLTDVTEKVDFLSRPKAAEGEGLELVDNNDEVGF